MDHATYNAGLEIATDTVANASTTFNLATKNSSLVATLATMLVATLATMFL